MAPTEECLYCPRQPPLVVTQQRFFVAIHVHGDERVRGLAGEFMQRRVRLAIEYFDDAQNAGATERDRHNPVGHHQAGRFNIYCAPPQHRRVPSVQDPFVVGLHPLETKHVGRRRVERRRHHFVGPFPLPFFFGIVGVGVCLVHDPPVARAPDAEPTGRVPQHETAAVRAEAEGRPVDVLGNKSGRDGVFQSEQRRALRTKLKIPHQHAIVTSAWVLDVLEGGDGPAVPARVLWRHPGDGRVVPGMPIQFKFPDGCPRSSRQDLDQHLHRVERPVHDYQAVVRGVKPQGLVLAPFHTRHQPVVVVGAVGLHKIFGGRPQHVVGSNGMHAQKGLWQPIFGLDLCKFEHHRVVRHPAAPHAVEVVVHHAQKDPRERQSGALLHQAQHLEAQPIAVKRPERTGLQITIVLGKRRQRAQDCGVR